MGRATEKVREISKQITSGGNLAGLTEIEARAWAIQTTYGQLAATFEIQGEMDKAKIAHSKSRRFFDDENFVLRSEFRSALVKTCNCIIRLIQTS